MDALGRIISEGDWLTIDGSTGEVMAGEVATVQPDLSERLRQDPDGLGRRAAGARGPGQCGDRRSMPAPRCSSVPRASACAGPSTCSSMPSASWAVREMILAETTRPGRLAALAKILPMQPRISCACCWSIMGKPVTVRLLDPPLHEFLPTESGEIEQLAETTGLGLQAGQRRLELARGQPDDGAARVPAGDHVPRDL